MKSSPTPSEQPQALDWKSNPLDAIEQLYPEEGNPTRAIAEQIEEALDPEQASKSITLQDASTKDIDWSAVMCATVSFIRNFVQRGDTEPEEIPEYDPSVIQNPERNSQTATQVMGRLKNLGVEVEIT